MKMRAMRIPKMQTLGHYRPAKAKGAKGQMNRPRRGRVGKQTPSMKRLTPRPRRGW